MKKKYISPEMDIIEFDTKDVITTSGMGGDTWWNDSGNIQTTVQVNESTG